MAGVYGALSSWLAIFPRKIKRLLAISFSFTFYLALLSATHSMDDIVRILNAGGVDSDSLAEVLKDYFCGNSIVCSFSHNNAITYNQILNTLELHKIVIQSLPRKMTPQTLGQQVRLKGLKTGR